MPEAPVDRDELDHLRAILEKNTKELERWSKEVLPTIIGQVEQLLERVAALERRLSESS